LAYLSRNKAEGRVSILLFRKYFKALPEARRNLANELAVVSSPVKATLAMENFWFVDVGPVTRQFLTRADDLF
jgi:hypothetical protein